MQKEKLAQYHKDYYGKHQEKLIAYSREYRKSNPDKISMANKVYRETHPEELAALNKAWAEAHKTEQAIKHKEYRQKHKTERVAYVIQHTYGITIDEYNEMYKLQEGRCAICGCHQSETDRRLYIDHDHQTGVIRGLLCSNCNSGIGLLRDDPDILRNALEYLRRCDMPVQVPGIMLDTTKLDEIIAQSPGKFANVITATCNRILTEARMVTPRDPARPPQHPEAYHPSGELRANSDVTKVDALGLVQDINYYQVYAAAQELGRPEINLPARPYLTPSVENAADQMIADIGKVLDP